MKGKTELDIFLDGEPREQAGLLEYDDEVFAWLTSISPSK